MQNVHMHTVLMAHGRFTQSPRERAALENAERIIAADGGAEHVLHAGYLPHLVVGDMDSIRPSILEHLQRMGIPMQTHPRHKDETDLELALQTAADSRRIVILGALGGRRDHEWANTLLLLRCPPASCIVDNETAIYALDESHGRLLFVTNPGDTVSLIPLAPSQGITTEGLLFPLKDEALDLGSPRGVSNVAVHDMVSISLTRGRLLVMHLPRDTHSRER